MTLSAVDAVGNEDAATVLSQMKRMRVNDGTGRPGAVIPTTRTF